MNRIRQALTTTLVGAALVTAGGVTAAPAQAATSTSFCFGFAQTGTAYANYPVNLWQVDALGNQVAHLRSGKTAANGCGTFTATPSNVRLRVFVHFTAGSRLFRGATPMLANTGAGGVHLGTGWVN